MELIKTLLSLGYGTDMVTIISIEIIVDSSFNNNGSGNVLSRISALTYDGQGRIAKEIETWYSGGSVLSTKTIDYAYDAKGNLVVEGWPSAASYDGNKSIFPCASVIPVHT